MQEDKNLFEERKHSPLISFLLTYGWAILIVLLAIAALIYYNLL